MKKLARNIVAAILGRQIRQLYNRNQFKVIAVTGSIGKTSTKLAIAQILMPSLRVQSQEGNYNHLVTAPLVFFGEQTPSLFNPIAWTIVFWRNWRQLRRSYLYDVVVLELGTDGPGQIKEFNKYLKLDIAVVTAITPEHMAFFENLDEVAEEELSVKSFSSLILVNKDLCKPEYLKGLENLKTYSLGSQTDFKALDYKIDKHLSTPEQYSRLAAASVAELLGLDKSAIKHNLNRIKPPAGRMQKLDGINNSTIIDDSYNASPDAMKLALDSLYKTNAPQKIALLGNMNELGDYSKTAHQELGAYCDPKQLDLVVTLGTDANEFLARVAEDKGCKVMRFDSPYKAGEYIKSQIQTQAAILVKGSQNKVFAEEAIKSFLADPADSSKLVRQSKDWLKIKQKAFRQ